MKDFEISQLIAPFVVVGRYLLLHRTTVYFFAGALSIIAAFISLNLALYQPTDADYRAQKESEAQSTRFDTDTIKKVQDLNASQQTRTSDAPAGQRSNPFSE